MLSVEAFQPTVIEEVVLPLAASPPGTDGACVSVAQAEVVVTTLALAERLPAAS